jgi:hypothetical protein
VVIVVLSGNKRLIILLRSFYSHSDEGLNASQQQKNEHDYENSAQTYRRIIAPVPAVRPRGQAADQQDEKDNKKDCA